ncbi:hypothetical protein OHC33_003606 [Knufia fluminis]|uniref:Exonuclease domain-containing protein n=1 Tax=Knufia fluminis TaxID=191047 RepID=A0AAN8ENE2_9EURO|nr:hypothetical protein OHC33_003606 [Knufia fluminis]
MSVWNQVQLKAAIDWSNVSNSPIVLEKLHLLTATPKVLAKEGYVFKPLTEVEIWSKNRCRNCGQRLKRYRPTAGGGYYEEEAGLLTFEDGQDQHGGNHDGRPLTAQEEYALEVAKAAQSMIRQKHHCFFHDGQTFKGVYQCCGGRLNTKGCCSEINHTPCDLDEVRAEWLYHKTPTPIVAPATPQPSTRGRGQGQRIRGARNRYVNAHTRNEPAPPRRNATDIRAAVALDCEMGTSVVGNTPLIRLSVVDFFTRVPLIDRLVAPSVEMAHYNTRFSGVTFSAMRNAIRNGEAILGTDQARGMLFKYVDANTFIVMHGGSSDLTALRMIHPADRIIDTHVLERYDLNARDLKKGLKEICERRCGIRVQNAKLGCGRDAGHDSLEDAMGAREIVCAWLREIPDE